MRDGHALLEAVSMYPTKAYTFQYIDGQRQNQGISVPSAYV